jgi:hypothetical protein
VDESLRLADESDAEGEGGGGDATIGIVTTDVAGLGGGVDEEHREEPIESGTGIDRRIGASRRERPPNQK